MPVEPRGFFSKHWEKFVLGVVVLGAAAAGYFAYDRATLTPDEDPRDDIQQLAQQLQQQLGNEADVPETEDFMGLLAAHYGGEALPQPPVAPAWSFWPPLPSVYPTVRVGTNETLRLRFDAPLESAEIIDGSDVAQIEHPVGANYQLVELTTSGLQDEEQVRFRIVGKAGTGRMTQQHILPVEVGPEYVGKVKPPLNFSVESQPGYARISFEGNPDNKGAGVYGYAVYRKRADALTGGFERLGVIESRRELQPRQRGQQGEGQGEGSRREQMMQQFFGGGGGAGFGGQPPGGGGRTDGARGDQGGQDGEGEDEEDEPEVYEQSDYGVEPGQKYIYKVKTLASRAPVPESDFTESIEVDVQKQLAWRFTFQVPQGIRIELVRVSQQGERTTDNFTVGIGEEIGGTPGGGQGDFLTGSYLVDYHNRARTQNADGNPATGRVIYQDEKGNLRVRWRNRSPSALWER